MSLRDYYFAGQGATWPILLGGQAHWTVGLVATLITISSIIAADTFAFLGGKVYKRIGMQLSFQLVNLMIAKLSCNFFLILKIFSKRSFK